MKRWVAGWVLVGAFACRVDEAREVETYRSVLDAGSPAEVTRVPGAGVPLDARAAMRLANVSSETLAIEGEAYLRACIAKRRAAAAWLPRIELSPSYFVRDSNPGTEEGSDVPVTSSLDVNPRGVIADQARAALDVQRRRALLYAAQDALFLDVARTVFEVLRAERSAAVLRNSLAVQEARVDDARARRDVGFARPLDVSLSESSLADARVALLEAEQDARTGRALLGLLVGADVEAAELAPTVDAPLDDDTAWLERARSSRPDLHASRIGVEVAAREVELASSQWWPSVAVDLDVFLARDSTPTDQDWRTLFEVRLPLFNGGRIHADVRDALSRLRESKLVLARAERSVRRDIEVARENLSTGERRVAELSLQLATAREALAQADGLYDAGLATNLERLTAQDDSLRVELAFESAELDLQVLRFDLWRAAGVLHEWLGFERDLDGDDAEAR